MPSITYAPIKVETLSAEELSALSAYDLGVALNEVVAAAAECGRRSRPARDRVMRAKIAVIQSTTVTDLNIAKAERIAAETELQHVRDRVTMLRLSSSILQSLLRAANIV